MKKNRDMIIFLPCRPALIQHSKLVPLCLNPNVSLRNKSQKATARESLGESHPKK